MEPSVKRVKSGTGGEERLARPRLFSPFRIVGLVSPTSVPFTSTARGQATVQITTSVGRALQTYDFKRGLNLVFVTRPETPQDITAIVARRDLVFAAWGDRGDGAAQGVWVFRRGKKIGELPLPEDLNEPIKQMIAFGSPTTGSWLAGCASTRIEVWKSDTKSDTLEHYTTLRMIGAAKGELDLTGGIVFMNSSPDIVCAGRKNGWVDIWNLRSGSHIYTIVPRGKNFGSVTCMEPVPTAPDLLAVAHSKGRLIIYDIRSDMAVLDLVAGTAEAPVSCISFRTDRLGAGLDGTEDGIMATATTTSGDVTFWDINHGGRVSAVLRGAHNPPSRGKGSVNGGVSKMEFLPGRPVIITSGRDNSLKTWIFDKSPFSPEPRILHSRSGHAAPVSKIEFLPPDFDGSEGGNKWLLTGGEDRSLWAWSLRRDGQSTEISQGNLRQKAKKYGIISTGAIHHGLLASLEDLKAPEITCIASCLLRDGGIGAIPGKQATWQKVTTRGFAKKIPTQSAEISSMTGWESVLTAHKDDSFARTWFWGRKRAGRWMFQTGDANPVTTVAMSPCGTFALLGSKGGSIDMYNLQSGAYRQKFPSKLTPAKARQLKMQQMKTADDALHLQSRVVGAFEPGTGAHTDAVTGLAIEATNKIAVSCSLDGTVKFWDFLTGFLIDQIDWSSSGLKVTACQHHSGNGLVALSCDDNSIRVVDMETRRTIRKFQGPKKVINDFCFSRDGGWLISASEDCTIRTWDLPTGHLIDAMRFPSPCKAVSISENQQFLAVAVAGKLGVGIWTNMSLFKPLSSKPLAEDDIPMADLPSASGDGSTALIAAAVDGDAAGEDDTDTAVINQEIDQLSADLMTLSTAPKAKWQTLLHLDLIKQRNKPKEAPKAPEKAPFFLSASINASGPTEDDTAPNGASDSLSRMLKYDRTLDSGTFSKLLRQGAASGNYDDFIDHLKALSPSAADVQIRMLESETDDTGHNELSRFIQAVTSRLAQNRDFELTQVWMNVLFRIHHQEIMSDGGRVLEALQAWSELQEKAMTRLDDLVGYCTGVVRFLRNPRA